MRELKVKSAIIPTIGRGKKHDLIRFILDFIDSGDDIWIVDWKQSGYANAHSCNGSVDQTLRRLENSVNGIVNRVLDDMVLLVRKGIV